MRQYIIISFLLLLFPGIQTGAYAQEQTFKVNPYDVLASWTHEDVSAMFGEGVNIIDTMSGQAYIAGFRYQDIWFDRPCELEFYFSDVNVSRFLLRFIHPNNLILEEKDKENEGETDEQGNLEANVTPDSVWVQRIKDNPGVLDSLKVERTKEFIYRKSMIEKDSLRGDSIIRDIVSIIGAPFKEGPTPHTDGESRYQSTWIRDGYSCSVKDYRKFAEVRFGISPAPGNAISEFGLNPEIKLIEKFHMEIKGETLEISLLGLPLVNRSIAFERLFLMASTPSSGIYLDELSEERQGGYRPHIKLEDLTGDGIKDLWLQVFTNPDSSCTNNFIYTMEMMEPLMIFDPLEDMVFELEGEFQDDYQAMVIIDGATRTYIPLDKNKSEYQSLYDTNGKLLKKTNIFPGCLERLEATAYKSKPGSQITGYMPVMGISNTDIIGYVQAIWDYNSGGWELRSLEIWDD